MILIFFLLALFTSKNYNDEISAKIRYQIILERWWSKQNQDIQNHKDFFNCNKYLGINFSHLIIFLMHTTVLKKLLYAYKVYFCLFSTQHQILLYLTSSTSPKLISVIFSQHGGLSLPRSRLRVTHRWPSHQQFSTTVKRTERVQIANKSWFVQRVCVFLLSPSVLKTCITRGSTSFAEGIVGHWEQIAEGCQSERRSKSCACWLWAHALFRVCAHCFKWDW